MKRASRTHRARRYWASDASHTRLEIIPMIDVMMFLLVSFVIIMSQMIQGTGFDIDLPHSTSANLLKSADQQKPLTLTVDAAGRWLSAGRVLNEAELKQWLEAATINQQTPSVVIAAHPQVPYQQVIHAMDVLKIMGVRHIGLSTHQQP